MKSSEPSDDVAAMRRLDQQAWGDAYDRYVTSTYAFIAHLVGGDRALAEELHQEAWMTAMSVIDQFASERGEFRGWLFGIAKRRVAMHFRRASGRSEQPLHEQTDQVSALDDDLLPSDVIEEVERADAERAALSEMDETARDVLVNKYVDSMVTRLREDPAD